MKTRTFLARRKLLAFGFMLMMPVALTVVARTSSASGYSVATGITGEPECHPDGPDDCPQ